MDAKAIPKNRKIARLDLVFSILSFSLAAVTRAGGRLGGRGAQIVI
jgi:hypothetical protein